MDILEFSGGKDSLTCLYLLREEWDNLVVLWGNAGAPWPQTEAFMEKIKNTVPHFVEVRGDVLAQNDIFGIPSDLVSIVNSLQGQSVHGKRPELIQSWMNCCQQNLWGPIQAVVKSINPQVIYRGQRLEERYKSLVRSGTKIGGIEYVFPIEDWTAKEVDTFLTENNIEIPEYYQWSDKSLDCWHCTAYLDERVRQIQWMKEHEPDKYRFVAGRLKKIEKAAEEQLEYVRSALG